MNLLGKIEDKTANVGIIGLGYVGLSLVKLIIKAGYTVCGVDENNDKISQLEAGKSYLSDLTNSDINFMKQNGFTFSSDVNLLTKSDLIIICVPTPLNLKREPDLSYINNSILNLELLNLEDKMIILESTTYPLTTRENIISKLEKKYEIGRNLYIGYSPERVNPSQSEEDLKRTTKIVSGHSETCKILIKSFYEKVFYNIYPVKSIEIAEAAKVLENAYRYINIGFIFEMQKVFEKLGININDVIDACDTKEFGYQAFYPSSGIGGHCIPVDPFYLKHIADRFGVNTEFIELARKFEIEKFNSIATNIENRKDKMKPVFLIGVAYKSNVNDYRESPALGIISYLDSHGIEYEFHDTLLDEISIAEKTKKSIDLGSQSPASFSLGIVINKHDEMKNINYSRYCDHIINPSKGFFDQTDQNEELIYA